MQPHSSRCERLGNSAKRQLSSFRRRSLAQNLAQSGVILPQRRTLALEMLSRRPVKGAVPWKACTFRDQTVYVRVLDDGKPIVRRGCVEIRYKLGATKSYRPSRENIEEIDSTPVLPDSEMGGSAPAAKAGASHLKEVPSSPAGPETIVIYTDGACSGNPGPAGTGIVIQQSGKMTKISEFFPDGTNNMAELSAILGALVELNEEECLRPIHLYTDSAWCLGVLIGGWKAKTNLKLIESIKAQIERCPKLEMLKVKGHAGIEGNEEADYLATRAIRRESGSRDVRARA